VPLDAFALALAAAVVHAVWNLLTARAGDSQVAAGVALAIGTLAFAPVAALTWDVRAGVVPFVVASSALEVAYLALLATAYQRAPLTIVYPIARGSAPVIVLVVSVVALGASLPVGAALGVLAVGAGVVLVRGDARGRGGTLLGLAVAACIAGYTLVDSAALHHAAPVPYLELVLAPTAALYLAGTLALRGGRAIAAEVRAPALLAGLGMFGAYALALAALARAHAAPVAAVRESSVVIVVLLTAAMGRERLTPARLIGALAIVLGVIVLALP